jgi:signal transduction histidine kinase
VVRDEVLSDSLVRVKVWSADGTIIYSDEPRLIGSSYDLDEEELANIEAGLVDAEVSDLTKPENRFEREEGKLLEVYLPLELPSGEKVLFEAYFRYDAVVDNGARIWRSFAPITIGALIVLELVQIPLAWSLAHRLRQRQIEREVLLERAIAASEHERRRIAQDLHDGVVQDLAGVSYTLAAMGRAERDPAPAALDGAAETVRAAIESLRTLLVELYPPNLADEGLGPAVSDLLARTRAAGIETTADTARVAPDLPLVVAQLIYRTIQEALRNVVTHADATSVQVVAATERDVTWAEVVDDGRGFDVAQRKAEHGEGHVGLLGLGDLTADAGGRLEITSTPGAGTTVRIEVPHP